MYLTLARAEKEMALARSHSETAKASTALQLKVGRLERELKETARLLEAVDEAWAEAERRKEEELAAARVGAVDDEFKNLVLDVMVEEQFDWEKVVARFNPDLDINFDISGVRPPISLGRELLFASPSSAKPITSPDAEVEDGAKGGGGDAVLEVEPIAGEV